MTVTAPSIRTPDQRLRVFVSSTLHELAEERAAVRDAIERIRLTPVLFEAGARSHPPRDLYRAYLAQSDIFVAIYWNRYGWVAPDMDISGLEDEFLLSSGLPRLVYVKRSDGREARLDQLLERLANESSLSFRPFSTSEELRTLVADDLAHLLTEGFSRGRPADPVEAGGRDERTAPAPLAFLPDAAGPLLGREALLDEATAMLRSDEVRLLTLTGPGGVGKTSLAVHLAHRISATFLDGAAYVSLASVREVALVLPAVIGTLELPPPPNGTDPERQLTGHLRARHLLLVLDNFEQVIDAAPLLAALLAACRRLKLVVTSRTPLRLSGEHEVRVPPLDPSWAARLFEERARAARPGFRLDAANAEVIETLCRRLDGLPLAIELAAARTKVLTPEAMLPRLDRALGLLTGGARDRPARQQTLRAAFAWSYELLAPPEQELFRRLGALAGSFSLDLAEAMAPDGTDLEVVDLLESLVDKSLVVRGDHGDEPRFWLLETAREFALETLRADDDERTARLRLVDWVTGLLDAIVQQAMKSSLDGARYLREQGHIAAALAFCARTDGDVTRGWRLFPLAGICLMGLARVREVQDWHARMSNTGPAASELDRARSDTVAGVAAQAVNDNATAAAQLESASARLRALGDPLFEVWATMFLAQAVASLGDVERGTRLIREAVDGATRTRSPSLIAGARMVHLMFVLMGGDLAAARAEVDDLVAFCDRTGERSVVSPVVAIAGLVSLLHGEHERARGQLANAVALARETNNPWGAGLAYPALASIAVTAGDLTEVAAIADAGLVSVRPAGLGTGVLELLAGVRGAVEHQQGDPTLACALLQLVPDGFEDDPTLLDVQMFDPLGVLRTEIRTARAALGRRARAAADRDVVLDDVLDRILRPA